MKKYFIHVMILLSMLLMYSCSVERRIARDFIKTPDKGSVLIFTPEYLFKSNLKIDSVENASRYSEEEIDSILYRQSLFLKEISDSVFLSSMVNAYISELEQYGFDVYTQEYIDQFMQQDDSLYSINMAQVELEEYVYEYRDEENLNGSIYYTDFDLNAVNLNAWFEIAMVNREIKEESPVLFASNFITDAVYGQFTQYYFSGEVKYDYRIDSLNLEKIYELAAYSGSLYANYTLNYIMNKMIRENVDLSTYRPDYMHYDPQNRVLTPMTSEQDGFVEMED